VVHANKVVHAGHWSGVATDTVVLAYNDRYRRRLAMKGERGVEFLLDLSETTALRNGDGLVLDDGRMIEVRAKPEPLLVVEAKDAHHLARLAWHLGNRHVLTAIEKNRILIRPDHVLAEMLSGLGATVSAIEAPFDPESGAYDRRSHDHHHDHGGNGHHHDHP
jgi:urease accessory protein